MPHLDGLEATRRIVRGREDGPRVLILTTFDLDAYVYEALQSGASGFVLKDIQPEKLVDAIHVIAEGAALLSPTVTRRLIEEFVRRPPDVGDPTSPGARAAHRPRVRDPAPRRPRTLQRRDRRAGVRQRADGEDPRRTDPDEARPARPGPGRRLRLRARSGQARHLTARRRPGCDHRSPSTTTRRLSCCPSRSACSWRPCSRAPRWRSPATCRTSRRAPAENRTWRLRLRDRRAARPASVVTPRAIRTRTR